MRISGGFARGLNLAVPKISDIRPAQEVVRQAIFSMLGERVTGAKVLDIYAGSGSYGLEALSRGATHATFVDSNSEAIRAIKTNLDVGRFWGKSEVVQVDALRFLSEENYDGPFDLIFADPPYEYGIPKGLCYHLSEIVTPDGLVIFDHAKSVTFDRIEDLEVIETRNYGNSGVTFLRPKMKDKRTQM
jgi:16S rRNA (guanine966-N2)-methyltransferase